MISRSCMRASGRVDKLASRVHNSAELTGELARTDGFFIDNLTATNDLDSSRPVTTRLGSLTTSRRIPDALPS